MTTGNGHSHEQFILIHNQHITTIHRDSAWIGYGGGWRISHSSISVCQHCGDPWATLMIIGSKELWTTRVAPCSDCWDEDSPPGSILMQELGGGWEDPLLLEALPMEFLLKELDIHFKWRDKKESL